MDEDDKPLGALLDNLGVVGTVRDGQQIVEALVICKVVDFEGDDEVSVLLATSKGLDWVAQGGLIAAAVDINSGRCESAD